MLSETFIMLMDVPVPRLESTTDSLKGLILHPKELHVDPSL